MDRRPIPRADRAALYLASLLTLLACAGTVVPLYLLGRSALPAAAAWAAAAFWPLVPAANLFQPDADTAYPFALHRGPGPGGLGGAMGSRERGLCPALVLAFVAGLVLAVGMFFTLAFLPVGLIVAL